MTDKKHILLVDDHPILLKGLVMLLEGSLPEYHYHTCTTFTEAEAFDAYPISFAVIDHNLGKNSKPGPDLFPILRQRFPEIKVCLFTHDHHMVEVITTDAVPEDKRADYGVDKANSAILPSIIKEVAECMVA